MYSIPQNLSKAFLKFFQLGLQAATALLALARTVSTFFKTVFTVFVQNLDSLRG